MQLAPEDLEALRRAKARLEHPSLAARLTDALASPLDKALARLPGKWAGVIHAATRKAISKALTFAVATIKGRRRSGTPAVHKIAVMTSGALGAPSDWRRCPSNFLYRR